MIRKEILRARTVPRDALLEKVYNQKKKDKITFNITYHPVFRDVRKILKELHVILASDDGHKKVFPPWQDRGGKPCGGKRPPCHLCENMKDT